MYVYRAAGRTSPKIMSIRCLISQSLLLIEQSVEPLCINLYLPSSHRPNFYLFPSYLCVCACVSYIPKLLSHQVFGVLKVPLADLSVHMVELSPTLSAIQEQTLLGNPKATNAIEQSSTDFSMSCKGPYKSCVLQSGATVSWYHNLKEVPLGQCVSVMLSTITSSTEAQTCEVSSIVNVLL